MYEQLKGKRLLLIGSDASDAPIVQTAHELGVYVIAVDANEPSDKTLAKNLADEAWTIDYSKTEQIAKMCTGARIDGVFAGYSEFRTIAACRIAKGLSLPFYAPEEVLRLTQNKRSFKEICRQYGLKTPRYFCLTGPLDEERLKTLRFPLVVKPVDGAGRKGLHLCRNAEELRWAVAQALQASASGEVIVEEYVFGQEFGAIYTIKDGYASLSLLKDKYLMRAQREDCLRIFSLAPSMRLDEYVREVDAKLRRMLPGIGVINGVCSVQGIRNEEGFFFFEMNLRVGGGNDQNIIEAVNGVNYLKMMLSFALTGKMEGDLGRDDPYFPRLCGNLSLYAKAGRIERIGYTGQMQRAGVEKVIVSKTPGMTVEQTGTTQQRAFAFFLLADSLQEMKRSIEYAQAHAVLNDAQGRDMILERFDTERLDAE